MEKDKKIRERHFIFRLKHFMTNNKVMTILKASCPLKQNLNHFRKMGV